MAAVSGQVSRNIKGKLGVCLQGLIIAIWCRQTGRGEGYTGVRGVVNR